MEDKRINQIIEALTDSMTGIEQSINWELALNVEVGYDEYNRAAGAIVEPRIDNQEASELFFEIADDGLDKWADLVIAASNQTLMRENWLKMVDYVKEQGY